MKDLYTAVGDCGMTKDKPVTGTLGKGNYNEVVIFNYKDIPCSINPQTLREANKKEIAAYEFQNRGIKNKDK